MLFIVVSTPRPEQPSKMRKHQQQFWRWFEPLHKAGIAKEMYIKAGRGAFVVFDVDSNEMLHGLINAWQECLPASFEVYPLVPKEHQERLAKLASNPFKVAATAVKNASAPGTRSSRKRVA